jgi:predicted dinucleotide-binding enzyme
MITPYAQQGLKITIVGVGDVGGALAPLLAAAGHQVRLASRRTERQLAEQGLAELLARPNVSVRPVEAAAADADLVLLSVPYGVAEQSLSDLGVVTGTVVVDATNYNRDRDGDAADPGRDGTTAVLLQRFPNARWVKSFNMLWAGWLRTDAKPEGGADRVVFVASDDVDAKALVAELIAQCGFVPFDTGSLAHAVARQLEGTPAWNQRLTSEQAARLLPDAPGARNVTSASTGGTTS